MTAIEQQRLITELKQEGITNELVLQAIAAVPRDYFIPEDISEYAYENRALPIGCDQTISQPYVVARMTEALLAARSLRRVLEIGTGSGYQAAVLAKLVDEVYTVERVQTLYLTARQRLESLGLSNVHCRYSDGFNGWAEQAPYDGIIVTAATNNVPPALLAQLAEHGQLIMPVGSPHSQELQAFTFKNGKWVMRRLDAVVFVPLLSGLRPE